MLALIMDLANKIYTMYSNYAGKIIQDFNNIRTVKNKHNFIKNTERFFIEHTNKFKDDINLPSLTFTIEGLDNILAHIPIICMVGKLADEIYVYNPFTEEFYHTRNGIYYKNFLIYKTESVHYKEIIPNSLLKCMIGFGQIKS